MFFRTCGTTIKDIYVSQSEQDIKSLNLRIASLCNYKEADKNIEAARMVVAVEPHFVYFVCSGLHGGTLDNPVPNDNGDSFLWSELLKRKANGMRVYEMWVGCPTLENHNPSSVRGQIIDTWPIKGERSIDMLHRIDSRINPNLCKGIVNGSIKGTSMGVYVNHSYCSICNNLAHTEQDWCAHLEPRKLNIKGKKYLGQDGYLYPDKIGKMCFEDNRDLTPVEDSIITNGLPADSKALIREVLANKN